jgi:hypothetical protein
VSRYRFIGAEKDEHAIVTMCRVLKVSRAAYYEWSTGVSDRVLEDRVPHEHDPRYPSRQSLHLRCAARA